jgi:hypothetical protein
MSDAAIDPSAGEPEVLWVVSSVTYSRNRPSSSSSIYGQNEVEDDDDDEQVSVIVFAATSPKAGFPERI